MTDPSPSTPPPRYLRFVTALLLGAAIAGPVALVVTTSGCADEDGGCVTDCSDDEPDPDARFDASQVPVDGPLHPPDLPRIA
jgi:hypothetical protein